MSKVRSPKPTVTNNAVTDSGKDQEHDTSSWRNPSFHFSLRTLLILVSFTAILSALYFAPGSPLTIYGKNSKPRWLPLGCWEYWLHAVIASIPITAVVALNVTGRIERHQSVPLSLACFLAGLLTPAFKGCWGWMAFYVSCFPNTSVFSTKSINRGCRGF